MVKASAPHQQWCACMMSGFGMSLRLGCVQEGKRKFELLPALAYLANMKTFWMLIVGLGESTLLTFIVIEINVFTFLLAIVGLSEAQQQFCSNLQLWPKLAPILDPFPPREMSMLHLAFPLFILEDQGSLAFCSTC